MSKTITELPGGFCHAGSLCFDFITTPDGVPYRIFVTRPAGEPPAEGWPMLYLTDGNACFPIAAAAHAIQSPYPKGTNIEPGIVVAIGYPTDAPFDLVRRAWDLTPPPGRTYPPYSPGSPEVITGGAQQFLTFIETILKPHIASRFPVNSKRQTLFGHSFGGLFALYALFTEPERFNSYVAASPSIFWEDRRILEFEADLSLPEGIEKRVLHLSAGEFEADRLAPFQESADDAKLRIETMKKTRTAFYAQEMADRLSASHSPNLIVRYETFPRENHLSTLPAAIGRALQIAFAAQQIL